MIYACVVTFNPDLKRLNENLQSLKRQQLLNGIIVVDNDSSNVSDIETLVASYECVILKQEQNVGIAKALNIGIEKARNCGAKWVLTCDQDSVLPVNLVQVFSKYFSLEQCAILCPQIYDENAETIVENEKINSSVQSIDRCITSGSMTNVQCWEEIGGFDEFLFIDGVDFDYCSRLKRNGKKIYRVNEVVMRHTIGNMRVWHWGPFKVLVLNHSPFRKYYILRNRIYCDFKMYGKLSIRSLLSVLKQVLLIIFFEKSKAPKLSSALKGIKDGFRYGLKLRKLANE